MRSWSKTVWTVVPASAASLLSWSTVSLGGIGMTRDPLKYEESGWWRVKEGYDLWYTGVSFQIERSVYWGLWKTLWVTEDAIVANRAPDARNNIHVVTSQLPSGLVRYKFSCAPTPHQNGKREGERSDGGRKWGATDQKPKRQFRIIRPRRRRAFRLQHKGTTVALLTNHCILRGRRDNKDEGRRAGVAGVEVVVTHSPAKIQFRLTTYFVAITRTNYLSNKGCRMDKGCEKKKAKLCYLRYERAVSLKCSVALKYCHMPVLEGVSGRVWEGVGSERGVVGQNLTIICYYHTKREKGYHSWVHRIRRLCICMYWG